MGLTPGGADPSGCPGGPERKHSGSTERERLSFLLCAYEVLGRSAEFVYGATQWEPELMALLRAGELIPVARRYPGAREFVESHRKEFPGADLSYHSAGGYGGWPDELAPGKPRFPTPPWSQRQ